LKHLHPRLSLQYLKYRDVQLACLSFLLLRQKARNEKVTLCDPAPGLKFPMKEYCWIKVGACKAPTATATAGASAKVTATATATSAAIVTAFVVFFAPCLRQLVCPMHNDQHCFEMLIAFLYTFILSAVVHS
jgi:Fe2+ transport system protein B